MMKFLLLFLLFMETTSHDIQVAFFKIYQDSDILYVDFLFEKEDVLEILIDSETKLIDESLQTYLKEYFSLTINHKRRNLEFDKIDIQDKHIFIQGNLPNPNQSIKSLEIQNRCLLDIEDHSNIVEIRLHDQERDFLMNVDRTIIKLNY